MAKIKLIHDEIGHTLTIWIGDPSKEAVCEETVDEIVVMKDKKGRVLGLELLNYKPGKSQGGITVETLVRSASD